MYGMWLTTKWLALYRDRAVRSEANNVNNLIFLVIFLYNIYVIIRKENNFMPRIKSIEVFTECGVCHKKDLYFVYDVNTWCLKQICNDCHTEHQICIVPPQHIAEKIKKGDVDK
jgi:hypothetical protein